MRISGVMGMLCVCGLAASAVAAPLTPGNLVVMKVGSMGTGSGEVVLSEYSKAGTALGNDIVIPFAGPNAISIPQITNHDRHIHRSVDGRLISFVGYNAAPDATDPSSLTSASTPRVVGLLDFHGNVDLSTKLTANYNATSIRGAATTDGSQIWTGGDNASGATPTGGGWPVHAAFDPSGRFLRVANMRDGLVAAFSWDFASGTPRRYEAADIRLHRPSWLSHLPGA